MATVIPVAKNSATWLPPSRVLAPNTLMTTTSTETRAMNGMRDTHHEGFSPRLKNLILHLLTYAAANIIKKKADFTAGLIIILLWFRLLCDNASHLENLV